MQTDKLNELEKTLRLTKLIRDGDTENADKVESVRSEVQKIADDMKRYSRSLDEMQKEIQEIRKILEQALQKEEDETTRTSTEL